MRSARLNIAVAAGALASYAAAGEAAGLRHLRFSPDGQYVLAQDDSRITVLTVQPLAVLFSAPAVSATLAEFTPDSRQIVFVSSVPHADSKKPVIVVGAAAHVERWGVAEHARVQFTEIGLQGYESVGLSLDGRVLAWVDFHGTLRLVDVAGGKTVLERKKFGRQFVHYGKQYLNTPGAVDLHVPVHVNTRSGDPGSARISFSPDGRFLIATPLAAQGSAVVFDSLEKRTVKLRGDLNGLGGGASYAFIGPDRLMVLGPASKTAWMLDFPSGRRLSSLALMEGEIRQAADPGFVILRACAQCVAAAIEYRTGRVIAGKTPVLDVSGSHYVAERPNGEIELGLYREGVPSAAATVRLEPSTR